MAVSSTGAITGFATGATGGTQGTQLADMNSFLLLFTTQLKNQDPTNPMESYELASQLAQFSTVEKLTQLNQNVELQQSQLASINSAQMVNMIGREIVGSESKVQLLNGESSKASYTLDAGAQVTVTIRDSSGQTVRTLDLGSLDAGRYDLQWDGRNDAGEMMGDGTYEFSVQATGASGNEVQVTTSVSGKVYSFRMVEGVPYLVLDNSNGLTLPISSVSEVHEAAEEESVRLFENPTVSLS